MNYRGLFALGLSAMLVIFGGCIFGEMHRPSETELYLARAAEKQRAGDLEGALVTLDRALEKEPDSIILLLRRATLWGQLGQADRALADFDRVIALQPENPYGYLGRGNILRKSKKEYGASLNDLNKAVELAPQLAEAYMARGATHSTIGNLEAGIRDLTYAIDLDGTLYRAYLWRAYAFVELNETDRALIDVNHIREHATDPVILERAEALMWELLPEN